MRLPKNIFFNKLKLFVLLTCISTLSAMQASAQTDSIKVFFWGEGPKGEKFKVYHRDKILIDFESKGKFIHTFFIYVQQAQEYGAALEIAVYRKGRYNLYFRSTQLNSYYDPSKEYYIIERNIKLKNKYAVEQRWSDKEPAFVD